ncbi:CDP-diacylglycerol diphosphatase [Paraburkholderia fungorum]|jgi:CDP-diacylglycerol pyrophosphatase|uniref:CDP-diacylglycerol pyrophosphatase n=1 Tax=Paraburkholderia fungorum TaxID=134537 RepID=A0AAP5QHP2_9BURK|nr:CDP-diacylglycerol diphosphatase [Paraburkholderia fungorum]MDT8842417.1 CDP-diacylglycerol diphosphatase [Paraburkholderia fungorum]PRZ47124.1 CDP-diacylglycerol pyrophosphatase [Paraburkholderia fungorum]
MPLKDAVEHTAQKPPIRVLTTSRLKHARLRQTILRTVAALALACTAAACARLAAIDSNALWKIVDVRCVPSQQATGTPGQCTVVNLDKRYAILKDIVGRSQHLLIPTDRVTGIESPFILAPNAPDYWDDAWTSRLYVEKSVKQTLPDNQLGLEINSQFRRSQNQLHIHIDCMQGKISDALARHAKDTPGEWHWDTLDGQRYRIMRVTSLTQADNPFRIVARDNPNSQAMAMQTVLVTGAGPSAKQDGWLIVNSGLDIDNGSGTAEGLLDHACRVADGG